MAKSTLHLSLVQFDIQWEQSALNLRTLERMIEQEQPDTDLILLPEMFTTGFTMNAKAMAQPMDGETVTWMQTIASRFHAAVAGSVIIEEGGQYYNRFIWMEEEGIKGCYDKRHLFTLAGEDQVYQAGAKRLMLEFKGWKFCPFICYDLRFPVWSRVNREIDVLIYVANWPDKRTRAWSQLLIGRAIENQAYVLGLNRIGWDGNQHHYDGASSVIDGLGNVILEAFDTSGIHSATLDPISHEITRRDLPFLDDADSFKIEM
ncbi:MAG: amidohydrolase [Saprospiraceae bacterium]|nr:amidohydrolase [Saprospiraceae bacterium]